MKGFDFVKADEMFMMCIRLHEEILQTNTLDLNLSTSKLEKSL